MNRRAPRVAELPYAYFGTRETSPEQRQMFLQMQANNDHLMNQLRVLARRLEDAENSIAELTQLVQSTQLA